MYCEIPAFLLPQFCSAHSLKPAWPAGKQMRPMKIAEHTQMKTQRKTNANTERKSGIQIP